MRKIEFNKRNEYEKIDQQYDFSFQKIINEIANVHFEIRELQSYVKSNDINNNMSNDENSEINDEIDNNSIFHIDDI